MTLWLIAYGISYVVCAPLCIGMFIAYTQGEYQTIRDRLDVGMGLLIGLMYGVFGPLGVFICWCLTGFAEHGLSYRIKSPVPWWTEETKPDPELLRIRKMAGLK